MKPLGLILGICIFTFIVSSVFFSLQAQTKKAPVFRVSSNVVSQENLTGAVLSAFKTENGNEVALIKTKSDPLSLLRTLPQASRYVALLENTGVAGALSETGVYTFFVPVNTAFDSLPVGSKALGSADERVRLAKYHIIVGKMMSLDSVKAGDMRTFSGDYLNQMVFDTPVTGSATHVIATYHVQNGVVYLIDTVLLPPERRPFPFQ